MLINQEQVFSMQNQSQLQSSGAFNSLNYGGILPTEMGNFSQLNNPGNIGSGNISPPNNLFNNSLQTSSDRQVQSVNNPAQIDPITGQTLGQNSPVNSEIDPLTNNSNQAQVSNNYGNLPLSFIANEGQFDEPVKFEVKGANETISFRPDGVIFNSQSQSGGQKLNSEVNLTFVGANQQPNIVGDAKLAGVANFLTSNDSSQWKTNVPTYGDVIYQQIYQGIDLVYLGNTGQLKSEFIVAPGANPNQILLNYQGEKGISIASNGDLVLQTELGEMREKAPFIYQDINGKQVQVTGNYYLSNDGKVGFNIGDYDRSKPLVIDPVLGYSTYLGQPSNSSGLGIAVDNSGAAYVTGVISDIDLSYFNLRQVSSPNSYYSLSNGAFITKLNPQGTGVVYSTFFGGPGVVGTCITVDANGNAYIGGTAFATSDIYSGDIPIVGGFQKTLLTKPSNNGSNGFVAELNSSGAGVIFSSYLGGTGGFDEINGIAIDNVVQNPSNPQLHNIYVTGATNSADFPTVNALFPRFSGSGGGTVAFVTKISGGKINYSTYLGGNDNSPENQGNAIAVDNAGEAYVTGITGSTDFPLFNALQIQPSGGFITKLNATGNGLIFSTYTNAASAIAVDNVGNAYITGQINSTSFPIINAVQTNPSNMFVTKYNSNGSGIYYSTYLGGSGGGTPTGIAVDNLGNAYITGVTRDPTDFPILNSIQGPSTYGGDALFVTKINPADHIVYSTLLDDAVSAAIAVDSQGNAYLTGSTPGSNLSSNFPIINGGVQSTSNSAFVTKIIPRNIPANSSDFNRDGNNDIILRYKPTNQLFVWIMNGTTPTNLVPVPISAGDPIVTDPNSSVVGVGDFLRNGNPDILFYNTSNPQPFIAMWQMTRGTISSPGPQSNTNYFAATLPDANWSIQGVGDFNGDGNADIVLKYAPTNQPFIWIMGSNSISSVPYPTGLVPLPPLANSNWSIKGVGDFTGNGNQDILLYYAPTGQPFIWTMNGTTVTGLIPLPSMPDPNWSIKKVADFNGAGTADILWYNSQTRQTLVWFMNQGKVSGQANIPSFPTADWEIVG